jgi:hypothetical protein
MDLRPLLALAAFGAVAWMQGPAGEHNAQRRRNDFRWSPDPALVKVAAGAHKSTVADTLWLRALPDMSKEFADPALKSRWMDATFESVTDLEPSFMRVYEFGQAYLTYLDRRAKGSADRAIALLEKGVRANPESAGLRVYLAMVWYMEKRDRAKTIEVLDAASNLPGFDSLSMSMLSGLRLKAREDVWALRHWQDLMQQPNAEIRSIAELNLWRTKAGIASRAIRDFTKKAGRAPTSPQEIADPEFIEADAIPTVLEGLEILAGGVPRYAALTEFEIREICRQVGSWSRNFRDERGRWPTLDDLREAEWGLPTAPQGAEWKLSQGTLTLVRLLDDDR